MIIKSHVRAGYRAAADYLKDIGENELTRLAEISDPDAKDLDEAFHNMWTVASNTKATKPLHHISINPFKDERLTDKHVLKIVKRCEEKYGYKPNEHQRVIVEHVKDGRQHFHVIWCRVSLSAGKAVWPGHHWKKSKQAAREMEQELGLKRPVSRRSIRIKLSRTAAIRNTAPRLNIHNPLSRPAKHYAGMLGEQLEMHNRAGSGQSGKGKGDKTDRGDGSGGGMASTTSALKSSSKSYTPPVKKYTDGDIGKGNGPERRRKNMWVAVERRQRGPKS